MMRRTAADEIPLLIALLRAIGIPARVHCVTINRRILRGLIRPPAEFVHHSYTEVLLENRWLGIDSYIVDAPLHRAAVARCRAEKLEIGYGVHPNGSINWDGRTDCFAQFANDGTCGSRQWRMRRLADGG